MCKVEVDLFTVHSDFFFFMSVKAGGSLSISSPILLTQLNLKTSASDIWLGPTFRCRRMRPSLAILHILVGGK